MWSGCAAGRGGRVVSEAFPQELTGGQLLCPSEAEGIQHVLFGRSSLLERGYSRVHPARPLPTSYTIASE